MPVDDPNDLERADQEIRINELKEKAKELTGGDMHTFESPDMPPEVAEQFWRQVVDYESAPLTCPFEKLVKAGIALPPAESMSDAELSAKLQEVAAALAGMSCYLENTDHLSDRELYDHLWHESLREAGPDLPADSGWTNHIDILGSGSEEDILTYLKYYADEDYRRMWAKDFPGPAMPAHENPPYDRDRRLPRAPAEPSPLNGLDEGPDPDDAD